MITSAQLINGMPGDENFDIINYSTSKSGSHYEGVTVHLEDENSKSWIGNFADEHKSSLLKPYISPSGVAFIFAGPNCYLVKSRLPNDFSILESYNPQDNWVQFCECKVRDKTYAVLGSEGGKILVLDSFGLKLAVTNLGICEGLKFDEAQDAKLKGRYYEFNLKKWIEFQYSLPDLNEI